MPNANFKFDGQCLYMLGDEKSHLRPDTVWRKSFRIVFNFTIIVDLL